MTKMLVIDRDGSLHRLTATSHQTVMEAIRDAGIDDLLALCGGSCSCATCHVYIDKQSFGLLEPMTADEDDLLDSSVHRQNHSRLSCQVRCPEMFDDLQVTIAPED